MSWMDALLDLGHPIDVALLDRVISVMAAPGSSAEDRNKVGRGVDGHVLFCCDWCNCRKTRLCGGKAGNGPPFFFGLLFFLSPRFFCVCN